MANKRININGMHCVSCEILLEKEFKKIRGLRSCKISHKKGIAEIQCSEDVSKAELEQAIKICGYEVVNEDFKKVLLENKNTKKDYLQMLFIVIGLVVILFFVKDMDLYRLLPAFGSNTNITVALLMGLVASVSSCLALVGGIIMGFSSTYKVDEKTKTSLLNKALPHFYFHLGRVAGFFVLGGLLGFIGSKINYSYTFSGVLTIIVSLFLLYIGLQSLNIVPNITKLGFHLPKFLSNKIHILEKKNNHFMPIVLGILTFFLPCGFTQTMQLTAVASQSTLTGAFIMAFFALGTMPVLLTIGIGATYARKSRNSFFPKLIGIIIIFMAIYSLNSGLVLSGSSFTLNFMPQSGETSSAKIEKNEQVVKMDVDWTFKPTEFQVKKGVPVRWEINGINMSGCSNEVVIPRLNISKKINPGLNVIEFTPEEEGVLPFSCWMGMINGRFIVN